ncbi:glycosyltransferase family 4 protein [Pseudanabaenaceae cyanobacterium LEGE 13415]|nr:glycosyltransferase family 4 protein [Pseudanabaenaceae cyanobacterium LEGE 13415]
MKIAVIGAKGVPPRQGGIEHYCAALYPRLVAQGHSVDLYARSSYTGGSGQYEYEGVRVISLPCLNLRGVDAFTSAAMGAIAARKTDYDIVHFHALGPALFTGLPSLATRSKIVVTCQGLDWQRSKWGGFSSRLIRLGEQAAARYAHEIVVVSRDLQQYFRRTYGRETIYLPNAPAEYLPSDPTFRYGTSLGLTRDRYLVFLGRLVPEKCPDLLLEAFQQLTTDWKLVFVGDSSDTSKFTTDLFKRSAGNSNVVFTGQLRGSLLAEIVRGAGLLVLPSNLEGLPLAMLEGMQEGVPIVASNIPPHQQLLEQGRGLIFEAGNLESCVQTLRAAIANPDQRRMMAEQAQTHVKRHYNWDQIATKTEQLYKFMCNTPWYGSVAPKRAMVSQEKVQC